MSDVVLYQHGQIAAATPSAVTKVNQLAAAIKAELEPCPFVTEHMVHGGIYTRTVRLPAGATCASILCKGPTTLIIEGTCNVWSNFEVTRVEGYTVLQGLAGRKIGFKTLSAVKMSMMFATTLTDVAEIQRQLTDEHEMLVPLSKTDEHVVLITGE